MIFRVAVSTPLAYGPHDEETSLTDFISDCLLLTAKERSC